MVVLLVQQRVAHAEVVEDGVIGVAAAVLFEDGLAEHFRRHLLVGGQVGGVGEAAVVVDGRVDGQAVRAPEMVVVRAVAGRDVDEASAGGVVDMLAVEQRDGYVKDPLDGSVSLALASDLMRLHGGRLDLQTSQNQQLTVTMGFPAERSLTGPALALTNLAKAS